MASPLFIWLGAGRARRRRVAECGQLLDQAARAGLPVPPGAILLDELLRVFLDKELIQRRDDRFVIPDPELFHNTLFYSVRLPSFNGPVWVRPAFDPGPNAIPENRSIDFSDQVAASASLSTLWTAMGRQAAERADILLMEEIRAEHAGTAHIGGDYDEIILTAGETASLPDVMPHLTAWAKPDATLPPFARRLQMLLRGTRRTFGQGTWQITWADDGRICYITGATALSATTSPP